MRNQYITVILLSFLAVTPSTAAAITEAKELHIQELQKVMNTTSIVSEMADIMVSQIIINVKSKQPDLSKEAEHIISEVYSKTMLEQASELDKMTLHLYDKYYTDEEIIKLTAFFNTQAGRKYIAVSTAMSKDIIPIAEKWGQKVSVIALIRVKKELKNAGY